MVNCKICDKYINDDKRRHYCNEHREFKAGKYRRKEYLKQYRQRHWRSFNPHMSMRKLEARIDGRIIPNFEREQKAILKEKRRIGLKP